MLNQPVDEVVMDPDSGRALGIRSGSGDDAMAATADIFIGDATYFPEAKSRRTGEVIRSVCILDGRPPLLDEGVNSAQVIIPQNQVNRRHDIYISILSHSHEVCASGKYVGIVSTTVETENPREEVAPGIRLLGPLVTRFDNICPTYVPVNDNAADHCFITKSYDASSHFETTMRDVFQLYKDITGEEFTAATTTAAEDKAAAAGGDGAAAGGGGAAS